jgi:hypothetical protein
MQHCQIEEGIESIDMKLATLQPLWPFVTLGVAAVLVTVAIWFLIAWLLAYSD